MRNKNRAIAISRSCMACFRPISLQRTRRNCGKQRKERLREDLRMEVGTLDGVQRG